MKTLDNITEVKGTSGVYGIRHKINHKIYVGSSNNVYARLNRHRSELRNNRHANCHLQRSWNKNGERQFEFLLIEECSEQTLIEKEQRWIDSMEAYPKGFNQRPLARSTKGLRLSAATKRKIADYQRGRPKSKENKAGIRASRIAICGRGKSKYKGVSYNSKKNRWEVRIKPTSGEKAIYLGMFKTQKEAAMNYDFYAIKFYDQCFLNFPSFDYSAFAPRKKI